jgi:hypothetical protein
MKMLMLTPSTFWLITLAGLATATTTTAAYTEPSEALAAGISAGFVRVGRQQSATAAAAIKKRRLQSSDGITGLALIYTGKTPHVAVQTLAFNTVNVVDLAALGLPSAQFNIQAIRTGTSVNSVQFSNGQFEGFLPYAYCANSGPLYKTCPDLTLGATVTVSVTPYPLANKQGTPFATLTTTLQIINSAVVPPPPPTSAPATGSQCTIPKVCALCTPPGDNLKAH